MPETLTVDINKEGIHSVSAPERIESERSLSIELRNHGQPTHVHLRLDGELASRASLGATNHYVETDRRMVELTVVEDVELPVTGRLEVVTGYGQQSSSVEVTLTKPEAAEEPAPTVSVTEEPAESAPPTSSGGALGGGQPQTLRRVLPVVLLAVLAIALAAVALQVGGDQVMLGSAVVVVGVLIAGYFLLRG